jgi:uncharacterized protein with HEPN domain
LSFCSGHDFTSFAANRQLRWAVIKLIQNVGEASTKISDATRAVLPTLPWQQLRAMRNVLVHQYHDIDDAIVWKTIVEDLPGLLTMLQSAIRTPAESI